MLGLQSGLSSGLKSNLNLIKTEGAKFFGTNLEYVSDGDTNGVFYWRGTNNATTSWSNPTISNRIILTPSTLGGGNISVLVDRLDSNNGAFYTNSEANSWLRVDLNPYKLSCNYYSIQNTDQYITINWSFQGSNDAIDWTTLHTVTNNPATSYAWVSNIVEDNTPYRYFRILMNGLDSVGTEYLIFSEFELYGFITLI